MKKIIFTIFLFLILLLPFPALAQDEEDLFNEDQEAQVKDVEGLRAEFVQNEQNPDSKVVKFEMILHSGIDSDRVKVTWNLTGQSIFQNKQYSEMEFSIKKGESYSIPIDIIPIDYGVTELYGKVEAYEIEGTYLVTVRKNFASNAEGEILPITDAYTQAKTMSTIRNIIYTIIALAILGFIGYLFVKRFIQWLNRDDVQAYDERHRGEERQGEIMTNQSSDPSGVHKQGTSSNVSS